MDDFGAMLAGFHHPLESNRMVLGHARTHNKDGIGTCEISLCCRGAATTERGAQTGHSGAVSYTGLVADAIHPQASGEQLFDEVVFLDVHGRAAEMGQA